MDRNKANFTSGGTNVFLGKVIISVLSRTNCSSSKQHDDFLWCISTVLFYSSIFSNRIANVQNELKKKKKKNQDWTKYAEFITETNVNYWLLSLSLYSVSKDRKAISDRKIKCLKITYIFYNIYWSFHLGYIDQRKIAGLILSKTRSISYTQLYWE